MFSVLRKILGILLIVIGLAALVTPLTPGSWLALIGLELLGVGFLIPPPIRRRVNDVIARIRSQR